MISLVSEIWEGFRKCPRERSERKEEQVAAPTADANKSARKRAARAGERVNKASGVGGSGGRQLPFFLWERGRE
jgi:hypothetical protein